MSGNESLAPSTDDCACNKFIRFSSYSIMSVGYKTRI